MEMNIAYTSVHLTSLVQFFYKYDIIINNIYQLAQQKVRTSNKLGKIEILDQFHAFHTI